MYYIQLYYIIHKVFMWFNCTLFLWKVIVKFINKRICIYTAKGTQYVTCGSTLKLMNVDYKVRLHSHDIKYGSGSGQQSVTGTSAKEDGNSYWLVKAGTKKQCTRG